MVLGLAKRQHGFHTCDINQKTFTARRGIMSETYLFIFINIETGTGIFAELIT